MDSMIALLMALDDCRYRAREHMRRFEPMRKPSEARLVIDARYKNVKESLGEVLEKSAACVVRGELLDLASTCLRAAVDLGLYD